MWQFLLNIVHMSVVIGGLFGKCSCNVLQNSTTLVINVQTLLLYKLAKLANLGYLRQLGL